VIVPHVLTPIRLAELPRILDGGFHSTIGTCPGPDVAALAWAHLVLEHGREAGDLRGVWCFNLGNIDATWEDRSDPSVAVFHTVPECEGPACTWHATHTRRAFESAEDGAAYYWRALRERFPDAFYSMSGGVLPFVSALRLGKYFTGDPAAYGRTLSALVSEAPPFSG
jgi:hypothetical protein